MLRQHVAECNSGSVSCCGNFGSAAAAAAEAQDLNAHLDLTEKEREYLLSRKRQMRLKNKRLRMECDGDMVQSDDSYSNRNPNDSGTDENRPAGRVYTGEGFIQIPNQRPPHIQKYVCL